MPGGNVEQQVVVSMVDHSPDAMLLFDDRGTIVYANAAVGAVLGWAPDELVGTILGSLLHPDDRASAAASMRSFAGEGAKARIPSTLRIRRPDGGYNVVEANGNPMPSGDGPQLNAMYARRGEFVHLLTEALDRLSDAPDLATMLALVPDLVRWRMDVSWCTAVWEDDDGVRHAFGSDLAPQLSGAAPDDPASPLHRAWKGEQVMGGRDDLPDDLLPLVDAIGAPEHWLQPVIGVDGRVRVVIAVWMEQWGHNQPAFDQRVGGLANLVRISLHNTQQRAQLTHDAHHDSLTGLANRGTFHDALHGRSATGETSVLCIDLDDFKPVNDSWGHRAGDTALVEIAQRLASQCRSGDIVARIGGDEFAVVCPGCDADEAVRIAERFIAALREPIDVGPARVVVGASVGVATGAALATLAGRADEALYRAKAEGRNRVEVAPAPTDTP